MFKQYKMLPLEKREDAHQIKPRTKIPKVSPRAPKILHRILSISENGKTAIICSNMKTEEGKLSVIDVNISTLGLNGVSEGDLLSYEQHDIKYERPMISFRVHQHHQYPKHLLTSDEVL